MRIGLLRFRGVRALCTKIAEELDFRQVLVFRLWEVTASGAEGKLLILCVLPLFLLFFTQNGLSKSRASMADSDGTQKKPCVRVCTVFSDSQRMAYLGSELVVRKEKFVCFFAIPPYLGSELVWPTLMFLKKTSV